MITLTTTTTRYNLPPNEPDSVRETLRFDARRSPKGGDPRSRMRTATAIANNANCVLALKCD